MFFCEFCKVYRKTFSYRTPLDNCFWWRKGVNQFVQKCSRRPQPQLPERSQKQRYVKDKVDGSVNIYQRFRHQPKREMGLWISEYKSDYKQDQNFLNQHSTEHQSKKTSMILLAKFMETVEQLEQFPDFLDITIINLKENGNYGELRDGSPYLRLQKKKTEIILTQYHR